ncbi:MAG TPA: hemerythrin domain-containing protein [Agromyces sp.]|nr:hemerythrin domain-containing protein [Agromyces sp.]
MTERAPACGLHVAVMRRQHQAVSDQLDAIEVLADTWVSDTDAASAARLADALDAVDRTLSEHLADEERDALPVLDAVLSDAEWDEISEHAQHEQPRCRCSCCSGCSWTRSPRRIVRRG